MRWIGYSLIILAIVGVVVCQVEIGAEPSGSTTGPWVRTSDGWESKGVVAPCGTVYSPSFHPVVLSLIFAISSVMALVAFPCRARRRTLRH